MIAKQDVPKVISDIELQESQKFRILNDYSIDRVKLLWQDAQEQQAKIDASTIPLSVVPEIETAAVNDLSQVGIYSIEDAFNADEMFIERTMTVPVDIIMFKTHIGEYRNRLKRFAFRRMNPDELSDNDLEILKIWVVHSKFENDFKSLEKETVLSQAHDILKLIHSERGSILSLFQSRKKKAAIEQAKINFDLLRSELEELKQSILDINTTMDDKTVIKSCFLEHSAEFYTFMEKFTGTTAATQNGDLPTILVNEIQKIEIDLEGLNGTLRPYQLFGTKYALYNKRTLLGDEMGLGKTIQALGLITHLKNNNKSRVLVIAPKSVMANWAHEVKKWTDIPVKVFHGAGKRDEIFGTWLREPCIMITNPEHTKFLDQNRINHIDCLVFDEAHLIKNPQAQRTQIAVLLAEKSEYVLFMSGTPLENNINEMKHLIGVLQPQLIEQIDVKPQLEQPVRFRTHISPAYLRRKRNDVLKELPDLDFIEKLSEMSIAERAYYNRALASGLRGLMAMRRAAFVGGDMRNSEKLLNVLEICKEAKENGHKVLVFSFFKDVLKLVHNSLGEHSSGVISGEVDNTVRQEMIDGFTAAPVGEVLICQIDAAGVGLNIQAANIVILCEPQWKPSTELQAIGRAYRMGQTRNVIVYRLLSEESIDDSITQVRERKLRDFNLYADDSNIADIFNSQDIAINEGEMTQEVLEIERERLRA